ncbi:hypothetical protein VCCP103710_3257, partial [Vibrio cholerae CP1037(10)]
MTSTKFLVR